MIQLYKENKSFREIATLMHMSFRDISAITKKVELQAARERDVAKEIEPNEPSERIAGLQNAFGREIPCRGSNSTGSCS